MVDPRPLDDALEVDLRAAGIPDGRYDVRRHATFAAVCSLLFHGGLALFGAWAVARSLAEPPAVEAPPPRLPTPGNPDAPFIVELPSVQALDVATRASAAAVVEGAPPPAVLAGGAKTPRIDTGAPGKGGDESVREPARNLAPHAEESTVAANLRDTVGADQDNLLDTSSARASAVDRRFVLEPMEATFVATGKGSFLDRRPKARVTATLGAATNDAGSTAGASSIGDGDPTPGVGTFAKAGGSVLGSATSTPKGGAAYGVKVGTATIAGADLAKARPDVDVGRPSVTSNAKGVAQADKDSDETVNALKSLVDTTTFGANKAGDGAGGAGGGGAAGAGGTAGNGSTSTAIGAGLGDADGIREHRRLTYVHALEARIASLVHDTFPKEDAMALRNGTVILDLVIAKAGTLLDVIVIRPSGFPIFDQNVVARLHAAGGFEPVPDLLGTGSIHVTVPILGGWSLN